MPLSALRSQAGSTSATVFIAQEKRADVRMVRLGLRTLDAAEVLEGLAEGDIVLLGMKAKPGKKVRAKLQAWQPRLSARPGAFSVSTVGAALPKASGK